MVLRSERGYDYAVNPKHVVKAGILYPSSDILVGVDKAKITLMFMTGTTETITYDVTKEATDAFAKLVAAMNA